jgi:hypothetical protein
MTTLARIDHYFFIYFLMQGPVLYVYDVSCNPIKYNGPNDTGFLNIGYLYNHIMTAVSCFEPSLRSLYFAV